jgi:DNA-binding MarR family transcriptional regulator
MHLLIRQRLYEAVVAAGFEDLTPAHLYVFQRPGPDGLRPTDLAARMNMTKQATNHLLSGLEARGYIERAAALDDGRGKVLHTTARGRQIAQIMAETSLALEADWALRLGRDALERLRRELAALVEVAASHDGP